MRTDRVGMCKGVDKTWKKEQKQKCKVKEKRGKTAYGLNYD